MAEGMSVRKGKSKRNKEQREERERQLAGEKEQESKQFAQQFLDSPLGPSGDRVQEHWGTPGIPLRNLRAHAPAR